MIVKICGITIQDDASAAVDGGANALGFNFYPRSPRYITPQRASAISSHPGVRRVGVFVNEAPARVAEIADMAALDVAQLHGEEAVADYPLGIAIWKAARVAAGFDLAQFDGCTAEALLLDGPASGQTFDWQVARRAKLRIILAGGLDAGNVAEAVALVRPWGVDACSRIESAPGKKDYKKMNEFLLAARTALGA